MYLVTSHMDDPTPGQHVFHHTTPGAEVSVPVLSPFEKVMGVTEENERTTVLKKRFTIGQSPTSLQSYIQCQRSPARNHFIESIETFSSKA